MNKFCLQTNTAYYNDLTEMLMAFAPYVVIDLDASILFLSQKYNNNELNTEIIIDGVNVVNRVDTINTTDDIIRKRLEKRFAKFVLYQYLSSVTSKSLPWGSLTGIRPTKLAYELINEYGENGINRLSSEFFVSDLKVDLVKRIIDEQRGIREIDEKNVDLFVNIPFCVSRCSYCSFLSGILPQKKKYVLPYVENLIKEIDLAKRIIKSNSLNLRAIYIGGGTPTALSVDEIRPVLKELSEINAFEFTVESGRPDTITSEKLELFKDYGVNRICVNPQTFNDKTLTLINRKHTVKQIYETYDLALNYGFDINMDLIAMLPDETEKDILNSVTCAAKLAPANVTLHTLALKRGSVFSEKMYNNFSVDAQRIIENAYKILTDYGYNPYYLYRQKYTSGNLENTGYTKRGKACAYDVDIMEETTSILVAGAGAIAKRVYDGGARIERCANVKSIEEYVNCFDTVFEKQTKFWEIE